MVRDFILSVQQCLNLNEEIFFTKRKVGIKFERVYLLFIIIFIDLYCTEIKIYIIYYLMFSIPTPLVSCIASVPLSCA